MATNPEVQMSSLSAVGGASYTQHLDIRQYCLDRVEELRAILKGGTAWGFLGVAAFVDFLSRLACGEETGRTQYKEFIRRYFPDGYRTTGYVNEHGTPEEDIASQFYHIFRCGVLHSFSLSVDKYSDSTGWNSSIIISTNGKHGDRTYGHLSSFTEGDHDSIVLIGDDLASDLVTTITKMFEDSNVQQKAVEWCKDHPPLGRLQISSH